MQSDHDPLYFATDPVKKRSTIVFEGDFFETHTHLLSSASIFLSFSLATCSSFLLAPFDSSSLPEKKNFPNREEGCPKHQCKGVRYATVSIQLSPEGEVNSGGYIPRREASRYVYPPLFTDPEGDSCFSIYQIRWIKKRFLNFFFYNFRETTRHFSLGSQNSEYPRIFRVSGANQNAAKIAIH